MIAYTLVRSNRKTVALYIRGGMVEIRAPLAMPKRAIDQFASAHAGWIDEKMRQYTAQAQERAQFRLLYGSLVTYRGKQYPIVPHKGRNCGFDGERFYIPPNLPPERIKATCVQIYRMLAKQHLTTRTFALAQQMSVEPAAVRITGARTRSGSCSGKKNINYSWRLVMAEDAVIDYVVVHELAHLTEMNHSARFWRIVEGVLPNYRTLKKQLIPLQQTLSAQDWN